MKASTPEELRNALDDVRRIREVIEETKESQPIRALMRPLMIYALVVSPVVVVYGLVAQWLMDAQGEVFWGLHKTSLQWLFGGALLVLLGAVKWLVAARAARQNGHEMTKIWRKMLFGLGYYRIVVTMLVLIGVLVWTFVEIGQAHRIAGLICLLSGVIMFLMPLALPLPEMSGAGLFLMVAGAIGLFVWPAYPFYKVAGIFGTGCVWIGLAGFRNFGEQDS